MYLVPLPSLFSIFIRYQLDTDFFHTTLNYIPLVLAKFDEQGLILHAQLHRQLTYMYLGYRRCLISMNESGRKNNLLTGRLQIDAEVSERTLDADNAAAIDEQQPWEHFTGFGLVGTRIALGRGWKRIVG